MSKVRTAQGKEVDIDAIRLKNEKVRAVGNINVNARGDEIDSNNNVIRSKTKQVHNQYGIKDDTLTEGVQSQYGNKEQ
jgi:hypothetical protein